MENQTESFFATIRTSGTGSYEITIPLKIAKYMNLNFNEDVKVVISKIQQIEKEEEDDTNKTARQQI